MRVKTVVTLAVTIAVVLPATTFAWGLKQEATPVFGADCTKPYKVDDKGYAVQQKDKGGYMQDVVDPSGTNGRCSVTIYRFTDNGHTCYLAKGSNAGGLYCVN